MKNVREVLKKSRNAALVLGAGISYDAGIPLGYQLPMQFSKAHQSLLKKLGILDVWQNAVDDDNLQKQFVEEKLASSFSFSPELQQAFLDWLISYQPSTGNHTGKHVFVGKSSDIHATFVIAWLMRIFKHLVTTNWDFLLEWHLHTLYDASFGDEPLSYTFDNGLTSVIKASNLFFLDPLEGDDYFWSPRWDIVSHSSDLLNLKRWTRPLWKLHGSPFFLACPQCGGFSRWNNSIEVGIKVNDPCRKHPDEKLIPEIILWGQGIDKPHPQVWNRLKGRLERADLIVVSGFSGSDEYIRNVIESHHNAWVINPDRGDWDVRQVNYVEGTASELSDLLMTQFTARSIR